MRHPVMQWEHMREARVRAGYSSRRPESEIEAEEADENKKRSPK